jgi:hypothetical protein
MGNFRSVRDLGIVVMIWVFCNFIMYYLIPVFVPMEFVTEIINFTTISESLLESLILAIDFKMLFVGIILFLIVRAFKEGYRLKRDAELTI